jgi:TPR repeat protein
MYSEGLGVRQDFKMSAKWLKKSAIQENASAQTSLGYLYDKGQGVKKDHAEAIRLYRLAANQGYAIAQRNLGFSYKEGKGVKKDLTYSLMWFFLAGTDEYEISQGISLKEQEGLMKILDQEEIKKAVEKTTNCFKKNFINC